MAKRATIYLDEPIHKALRLKAAETDTSISEYVNNAVREALAEDADDLAAFIERADEPTTTLEDYLADMKQRGRL